MGALFGFSGEPQADSLAQMAKVQSHRGHGEHTELVTPHFSLGQHQRRFEPGALHAPLQRGDRSIAFSGKLYPTAHDPTSPPSLSELLSRYDREGCSFVEKLNGAFIIVINEPQRTLLFRDAAGHRTFYYARIHDRWYFSTEPKGIHQLPQFNARIRPAAVAQFFTFSFIPGSSTMLEGLHEVAAGSWVELHHESERPMTQAYFEPSRLRQPQEALSDTEWIKVFKDTFDRCVTQRLPNQDALAVFLSGGLDSSIVTAQLAETHRESCPPLLCTSEPSIPTNWTLHDR